MASGLHSFIYREIRELTRLGLTIHIFPTKVGAGPYAPETSWPVYRPNVLQVAAAHFRAMVNAPSRYLKILRDALAFRGTIDFVLAVSFSEIMTRLSVELIHCHFGDHKFFIGHFCGQLTGKPVTVTIHAYELYNNPNPRLFQHALECASAVVTISNYNRGILETAFGIAPSRIAVIPLFADIPRHSTPRPERQDKTVILTVARLVEKKGHHTLLEALARLPANYEAWIVGRGPLDVQSMAKRLGVEGRVRLLGGLDDHALQEAYRSADIFCLPSETTPEGDREGIPVAMMEAMANGLPVVATRHAGIPELVSEILVDEGDSAALARALERLGRNVELRDELGRRNQEVVRSRYSVTNASLTRSLFARLAHAPA